MAEPTCWNCFFWRRQRKMELSEHQIGECRRFPPPSAEAGAAPNRWSVTKDNDWCGEHVPKAPAKERGDG